MGKAKTATEEGRPKTRNVRVNEHTTRSFVDVEPIVEQTDVDLEEEPWDDPIESFRAITTANAQHTVVIWRLPNYDIDGRTSPNGTDREYCGSIPFRKDDDTILQQIHQRVPLGGMVFLEFKENGAFRETGLLKIAKPPNVPGQLNPPQYPSLVINQPQQQPGQTNSLDLVTQQFDMVEKVVDLAKKLIPPAPVVNVGESNHAQPAAEKAPLEERILETVVMKALESDKAPIDKVLEVLSGRRAEKPGFMDSLAPLFADLLKTLAPAISMGIAQYARSAGQAAAATQPAGVGDLQGEPAAAAQIATAVDPAERAWRRVVGRMLEDCYEHVVIRRVSAEDGINVMPAADSIADLLDRFPSSLELKQMVTALLDSEPGQVIDMCAMLQPTQQAAEAVMALKEAQSALTWLAELQLETKRILSEADDEQQATA